MRTIILFVAMLLTSAAFAQYGSPHKESWEKIQAEKVAFITQKVGFTVEEAQKFWPLYNEKEGKLKELHDATFTKMKMCKTSGDKLTPKQYEELADAFVDKDVKEAKITQDYHTKFKAILPAEKVVKLYKAEMEFRNYLIKELRNRHGNGNGKGNGGRGDLPPDE